jgi:hypothetical protein
LGRSADAIGGIAVDKLRLELTAGPPTEPPLNGHAQPGPQDDLGPGDLSEVDWETTRYLSAAVQLDPAYARQVVQRIIGEPFLAVAPAAGTDVVTVTRWALAGLRRQAQRDAVLTCLLLLGIAAVIVFWTWLVLVSLAVVAILVVAYERWVRDEKIIARLMLRGRFRGRVAPVSTNPRIEERLAVVKAQQRGNLVVFRGGQPAFVGSGLRVLHRRILIQAALGRRKKNGKRQQPIPFSNPELHGALEKALNAMGFPELRVGERLYVNGQHVADDPLILPHPLGPPVASPPFALLYNGCVHPTPDARTYLCAEIGGWKGQLVVSLFARAVQARGSLQVEWGFRVLPPLKKYFLEIDRRYELPKARQVVNALGAGVAGFAPALLLSPVRLARYLKIPLDELRHIRKQSYAIRNGLVFDYGSERSIREDAIGGEWLHYFLAQDELTFILLAEHTMLRALGNFLKAHKVDMEQFEEQEKTFINNVSKYNINQVNAQNVSVGDKSRADGGDKSNDSSSSD